MPELRCAQVDDHYVLRDGAAGLFLAASKFPKTVRHVRHWSLSCLPHRAELDPKISLSAGCATSGSRKAPTVIRYSRKSKSLYVMSEKENGKPSGWTAIFDGKKWKEKGADSPFHTIKNSAFCG